MNREENLVIAGLFSGIGGFELAFQSVGSHSEVLCEIDPVAKSVLAHRFPTSQLISDVREIDCLPQRVNALCAGFPCQDLSSVGLKEGMEGERSSLITEVFRILRIKPVEWVVIENVAFMLRLKKGEAIRYITRELERLGYNWAYRVIDSAAFVPQRRERVYIVATLHYDPREILLADNCDENRFVYANYSIRSDKPIGFYWTEGKYSLGIAYDAIPTLKAGSTIGIPSPPAIAYPNGFVATPDIRDAERLQGFPADWTFPAINEARESIRWRLVGNAVTVDVVKWIANRIKSPGVYSANEDKELSNRQAMPKAAWHFNGVTCEANVTQWPFANQGEGLEEFLRYDVKPLSQKATAGFLNRVACGGLRTPQGFVEILQQHKTATEVLKNGLSRNV